jgi:uncharacterized protein (DUF1499 family)
VLFPNFFRPTPPLFVVIIALGWMGVGCSSPSLPSADTSNPLPNCPDSPNCERVSTSYEVPADTLYAATTKALDALGPVDLQRQPDSMRASAVYRVAWVFKDDVDVAVDTSDIGSRLHVRSASRVGESDLGVNARRVNRLLRRIEETL